MVRTAPLIIALLAKAARLGIVARPGWRGPDHVRTVKNGGEQALEARLEYVETAW